MSVFLEKVVSLLPEGLQPYAKALVPLFLGAVLIIQDLTISAAEVADFRVAVGAAVVSIVTLLIPNIEGTA